MPENDLDLTELDTNDPEAVKRLRDAYERQAARNTKAEEELAALRAEQRKSSVQGILNELHAPAQLADLFPADGDVSEETVKTFLRDKVGLEPDVNEAWNRYQSISDRSDPPPPAVDEDEKWAIEEMAKTAKFMSRQNAPTDQERAELDELLHKVEKGMRTWDEEVSTGKRELLVQPQGFGGFLDPPQYARRARHFAS